MVLSVNTNEMRHGEPSSTSHWRHLYWAQMSQTPCETIGNFEAFSVSLKIIEFVQTNQVLISPLSHGK